MPLCATGRVCAPRNRGFFPNVRILGRRGAQRDRQRRFPTQVPVDAVQAGLQNVGTEGGNQGAAGVADLDHDGVVGGQSQDVRESGLGICRVRGRRCVAAADGPVRPAS